MTTLTHKLTFSIPHPRWRLLSGLFQRRRRRRAMLDLMHGNPHLLRDIGMGEDGLPPRHR